MRVPGDYGFACPYCRRTELWDRVIGWCYNCGYRTDHDLLAWLLWKLRRWLKAKD